MNFENTRFGFNWGAAKVTRLFDDEVEGWVTIGIETPKMSLQVYVTKTGKVRVYSDGEWTPTKAKAEGVEP